MIALDTDRKAVQSITNVDSVLASIKHYYDIKHCQKAANGEHAFNFGQHPICEHYISFSPFGKTSTKLVINEVSSDLVNKITEKSIQSHADTENQIRKNKGNQEANGYIRTFDALVAKYFLSDSIHMTLNTYQIPKIGFVIDIETIDDATLDAISEILKHSKLLPKAQSVRVYEL